MSLPDIVRTAWANREGPVVFATVARDGTPNIIYATCVALYGNDRVVVADNHFDKTKRNIQTGSRGALLFITKDKKAFQLKGDLDYHTDGPVYADMKTWNPPSHPGHGAAALIVREVFSGATRLTA